MTSKTTKQTDPAKKTTAKADPAMKTTAKKRLPPTNARTEIVFILDRSGSMSGREQDVIGGYNRLIAEQKGKEGACHVSTVLFDDNCEVLHDRVPVDEVRPITENEYFVRGCTAYYDALGRAILHHIRVQRHLPAQRRAERMLFVVMTDGEENASREITAEKLRRLITVEQDEWGWEFMFIGAGVDAIRAATHIGIKASRAINTFADRQGVALSYDCMCKAVSNLREGRGMECNADGTSYREEIDVDYEMRKQR